MLPYLPPHLFGCADFGIEFLNNLNFDTKFDFGLEFAGIFAMMAYLFHVHVTTRMHLVLHPPVKMSSEPSVPNLFGEEELLVC
jgi:hypothetical protein